MIVRDDRLPPNDADAELSLIGSVLIDPSSIYDVSTEPIEFFTDAHRQIWKALSAMTTQQIPIDFMTVGATLKASGQPDHANILISALSVVPTAENIAAYARIVRGEYARRCILVNAANAAVAAYDNTMSVEDVLDMASKVATLGVADDDDDEGTSIGDIGADIVLEMADVNFSGWGMMDNYDFSRSIKGWKKGTLNFVAGRPGSGKSTVMAAVGMGLSKNGYVVDILSFEMSRKDVVSRMMAANTAVPLDTVMDRGGTHGERDEVSYFLSEARRWPLRIFDRAGQTIEAVRRHCVKAKKSRGVEVVIVDYLQLMDVNKPSGNAVQDLTTITIALKKISRDLDICLIVGSQLNRAVEARQNKRPTLADLRGSGSIEQDADTVMFLYFDQYYNPETTDQPNILEIGVGKNRNGPTGVHRAYWTQNHARISNTEQVEL